MNQDLISRQATMKEFSDFVRASNNSDFARTPTWNDAVSLVGSMPSAQPEKMQLSKEDATKDATFPVDGEPIDCISRQQAILAIERNAYRREDINETEHIIRWVLDIIKWLPSEQPEVIRCEDCKWRRNRNGTMAWIPCRALVTPDDFYCKYAERKEQ